MEDGVSLDRKDYFPFCWTICSVCKQSIQCHDLHYHLSGAFDFEIKVHVQLSH